MDDILKLISTLFAPQTKEAERKQADELLKSFQKTVRFCHLKPFQQEAWNLAHLLLTDSSRPLEARLFAAQTLRQKVVFFFS